MRSIRKIAAALSVIVMTVTSLACVSALGEDAPYHFVKEIPVGGEGGWDYLSVDAAARRLYVSHFSKVVVIDLDKNAVVGEIADTPGVHGIAVAPELGKAFTSNGGEAKASVVDLKTLMTLSKLSTDPGPDAILYDPSKKELYTFNGRGHSASVFSADSGASVGTIALPGKPEFAVVDTKAGRIYNNIEDKSEVVAIDTATHKVAATWPLAPGEEPSGMAIDVEHHRLFCGCGNKLMAVVNSEDGKVVATVPIGDHVDANAFDPATQLAFSSCGDGTLTIAHEDSPDKYTTLQTLATERGGKTMALDPTTHKIYVGAAKYEPAAAGQRPKIIAGSLRILVYEMSGAPAATK